MHEPRFGGRERDYVCDCIDTTWVSYAGAYVGRFEGGSGRALRHRGGDCGLQRHRCVAACPWPRRNRPGDEVLVPALTFVGTANAIAHAGAIPHFVDADEATLGIDAQRLWAYLLSIGKTEAGALINRATGRRIAAVLPVHIFGHPVDMDALGSVAREFDLAVIEDAAEALGSRYRGRPCGSLAPLAALSFNGNKIVTTGGGGAVLTSDLQLAERLRHLTTTAKLPHPWAFIHDEVGYNFRLPNLNAALGLAQLEQLDAALRAKRTLWARYRDAFAGFDGLRVFEDAAFAESNHWLVALVLDEPDALAVENILAALHGAGILARPAWTPMHRLAMYRDHPRMALPVVESLAARIVNCPQAPISLARLVMVLRVCVVSSGRADFGLVLEPMRRLRDDRAFELAVVLTGQHVVPGASDYQGVIAAEQFGAVAVIDLGLSGDDAIAISRASGRAVTEFGRYFHDSPPDLVLLVGDRYEMLCAAFAATLARLPIAHIAGGDVTDGAFDDLFRHAITAMAHIHFVTNKDAARRVRQLGQAPDRIHQVGSPGLDLMLAAPAMARDVFFRAAGLNRGPAIWS